MKMEKIRIFCRNREKLVKTLKWIESNTCIKWFNGLMPTEFIPPETPVSLSIGIDRWNCGKLLWGKPKEINLPLDGQKNKIKERYGIHEQDI
jgi:hypothetical protein